MSKKLNKDDLERDHLGKTYGWLTVKSVYRDNDKGRYYFKCICKCGKEVCKQYDKVISGHTRSCGCYKFSKEYSDSLSNYWVEHHDKVILKNEKYSNWCKDNPDKVANRSKKQSQFYKNNPDRMHDQIEKRKETFRNNPDIQKNINEKLKAYWDENRRLEQSKKLTKLYSYNPEYSLKISESLKNFYKNNPDKKDYISNKIKEYCKNNPDKVKEVADKHRDWFDNNRIKVIEQGLNQSKIFEDKRLGLLSVDTQINNNDFQLLLKICHPDYIDSLLNGKIKVYDSIPTKCPVCSNYCTHLFGNIWRLNSSKFRTGFAPMCDKCRYNITTSNYEDEIADYISTFYNSEFIRNSRDVISPLELDLYYPEKKIAIEFNGDYWHSLLFKNREYHYNKFKKCYDLGITLVSIFEHEWNTKEDYIKLYLKDLFNETSNEFSFLCSGAIVSLDYPPPNLSLQEFCYNMNHTYKVGDLDVLTCGYASKSLVLSDLKFLADLANENNLTYFINEHNDLEIKDKNICFHLADLPSGEKDAMVRWQSYHDSDKRCVFIYPPYLNNPNRVNVYKNILLYHCGLAKRIYARNTIVRVYPAVQMKRFFNENNIEGYRNANTAYVLEDKKTGEQYMCYSIGHSYFGKGNYDCEIARGACKLGYQVIGGASKLWKYIIEDNPDIKSIVYYCDRREYDQRSINHLMDSDTMKNVGAVYMLKGGSSFMNYWINDTYIEGKLWHRSGDYTNREPNNHKLVMQAISNGDCIQVMNPGSYTNVFVRSGYKLNGFKIVPV